MAELQTWCAAERKKRIQTCIVCLYVFAWLLCFDGLFFRVGNLAVNRVWVVDMLVSSSCFLVSF